MAKKVDKDRITAKDAHRQNLLEYLSNPENPVLSRTNLSKQVLGISTTALYKVLNGDELSTIEGEALDRRRARYGLKLAQVDGALFEKAIEDKDVKAIELVYKKFENWNPNQKIEINTSDNFNETLAALADKLPE